jgi:hypothetical protein
MIRRRSGMSERGTVGQWLEDRGNVFWFFLLLTISVIYAMIAQLSGSPSLLNFIDEHTIWFAITLYYLAIFLSIIGRIYFPLMLGAPKILRKERHMVSQFKLLTAIGLALGPLLAIALVGTRDFFRSFPATAFLITIPVTLMWAYLALVLNENDYEDERVWSYLAEIGAGERLEFRQHGYFVLIGLPLAALLFYYFMQNKWIAYSIRNSVLIEMFRELWHRATTRGA